MVQMLPPARLSTLQLFCFVLLYYSDTCRSRHFCRDKMRVLSVTFALLFTVFLEPVTSYTYRYNDSCPIGCRKNQSAKTCKDEKVVMCYFTNWATYRKGIASYSPENIDPSLCTHILYAFAILDDKTLTIVPSDSWADYNKRFYEMVTALKKKCVKVFLSIGGWNNSGGDRWHRMLSNETARKNFVTNATQFLLDHCWDGLDLDYEYPGCAQADFSKLYNEDKINFVKLLTEIRIEFKKVQTLLGIHLELSVAVSGGEKISKNCYDMSQTCKYADYITIMGYDYYSSSDGSIGPQTPLLGTGKSWGLNETLQWYLSLKYCCPKKLVLGISAGAQTYTTNSSCPKFGNSITGAGTAGNYTALAGFLAYYEICYLVKNGWDSGFNRINGSWASSGDQFISYSGIIDNNQKCCWVKQLHLAGVAIWALDYDDFTNRCGCGPYPLLTALNQHLRCRKGDKCYYCY